jgi:phosphate transport system ATP-binding protein
MTRTAAAAGSSTTLDPVAIRIRGLAVAYQGRDALRDVDLDVPCGRVTAIVGPSGCGKSSLLSAINRMTDLIPGCVVRGRLEVEGADAAATDPVLLRRRVGMIFQRPNPFPMSVRKNLHLPLADHGCRGWRRRQRIAEAVLRRTGLWDEVAQRLDAPATTLSGGQQQRLCVARALTLEPRVLLMDEPCSALDPIASETIERLILDMRGSYTVVVVTHNLAQARRLADHIAVMWTSEGAGRLVEAGPAREIFERPRSPITRAYLEGARG